MSENMPEWVRRKRERTKPDTASDPKLSDGRSSPSGTRWDLPASVPCLVCVEEGRTACLYRRITDTHLRQHGGMTGQDYKRRFPTASMGDFSKRTDLSRRNGHGGSDDATYEDWMFEDQPPESASLIEQRAKDELQRLKETERLLDRAKRRYDEAWDNYVQQKETWLKHQKEFEAIHWTRRHSTN